MSYPRNAASPERVSIGAVVQITDGAVQTSGVAVKVIPFGGSEASGTGTVAYSADGVVLYTPVQAETNYTSFVLVASKAGCIPANTTIVTQASTTAGTVRAASIATDAIDAASLKADAVAEIQSGLATAANVSDSQTAIITQVDANETKIDAIASTLAGGVVLDTATQTQIDSILEDTGTTLPGLIEGIPKVGSTHRYTQVAQTSTTTDVSIGEAT